MLLKTIGAVSQDTASGVGSATHTRAGASNVDPSREGALGAAATDEVVRRLRGALDDYQRRRAERAGWTRRFVPTGLVPLDGMLPGGGLPCGAITEVYADDVGFGSMTLALRLALRLATRDDGKGENGDGDVGGGGFGTRRALGRPVVWIDTHGDFYPPAAARLGVSWDRLIVLRVRHGRDALWAAEQSLRCSSVGVVVVPLDVMDGCESRRLQLAAESAGGAGLVLRPMHRRTKSFAAIQMMIEGSQQKQELGSLRLRDGYFCRITLLAVREGMPQAPCWVDLYHETGACDLLPLPIDRPIAKTG